MIQLQKVDVVINDQTILHAVDFTWTKGETIALVGSNGAGKSTLLKVLALLMRPASGKVIFSQGMDSERWRRSIGVVFPETLLYDHLTVYENLHFYRQLYNVPHSMEVDVMLKKMNLLHVRNEPAQALSKGMRQRLSIARSLIHCPSYLLLDEPFDGLDFTSAKILKDELLRLKKEGVGAIIISHQIDQVWSYSDRVVLLDQGRIVLQERCDKKHYVTFLKHYRSVFEGKGKGAFY